MSAYTAKAGDTFDTISRALYGDESRARQIQTGNPGISDPPSEGSALFTPNDETPRPPSDVKPGEISVTIDGEKFVGWTDVSFSRVLDSFGVFSLQSLWEPDNDSFRQRFRPFGYQSVAVFDGSDLLFNGTMIEVRPNLTATKRTVSAAGYSLPGVINDCTAPISALPLERDGQDLNQIAAALLSPFGIAVEVDGEVGPAFDREAIEPTAKLFGYLVKLAQQRKMVITDTPEGACRFHTEVQAGSPVAVVDEDQPGITSVAPLFNTQDYYSHITGQAPSIFAGLLDLPGGSFTVANPRLVGVLRPFTFKPADTLGGDLKTAVEAKAGRMFANAVQYRVEIPSWRDPNGALWQPNTTIKLTSPGAMVYQPFEFLVRAVEYRRSHKDESVTLTLALPGSFKGETPGRMPWED